MSNFVQFHWTPSGEIRLWRLGIGLSYFTQQFYYGSSVGGALTRVVLWGHPRPRIRLSRVELMLRWGYIPRCATRFYICPTCPMPARAAAGLVGVVFLGVFPVRRSFWVGSGSGRVGVGFRRVVGLALAGGCCSWLLRPSVRSFSGSVVWCFFLSRSRAGAFAVICSRLVGFAVCVRPGVCSVSGLVWVVSVPVVR